MDKKKENGLFEKYRMRYERGFCTREQLARLVELGAITAGEYKEITGEDYE